MELGSGVSDVRARARRDGMEVRVCARVRREGMAVRVWGRVLREGIAVRVGIRGRLGLGMMG